MDAEIKSVIESDIHSNKIFLFMKGTPEEPECGFSRAAATIIARHTNQFSTCNVLADENIRQGIKEFSNWPTIPQLYVDGKFVGGYDIMMEMEKDGELSSLLS